MLSRPHSRRLLGFTLVEVLVALLIAAVVGVLSFRGLDALLRADEQLEASAARWLDMHRFVVAFETDVRAGLARGGRDAGGTAQPGLIGQPTPGLPFGAQLALMRPNDPRFSQAPPVQRVAYRFADERVDLLLWPAADLSPHGEPQQIAVLEGVEEFALRYIGRDGVWRDSWTNTPEPPRAVELRLKMRDPAYGGPLQRVFTR